MERIPKGLYTPEFRAEAVKLVVDSGLSVGVAAKRLSVPKSSLANCGPRERDQATSKDCQTSQAGLTNPLIACTTQKVTQSPCSGRCASLHRAPRQPPR